MRETGQDLIEDGGCLNGFGVRRRDDDEETAISGRSDRKEGRIHEHDSTAIAPDADADGLRVAKTGILLGESFNLSGRREFEVTRARITYAIFGVVAARGQHRKRK